MEPIEELTNEHGLIRQYLDTLERAAGEIENGRRPSVAFFEKAIDFGTMFADSFHHFKEEHVLFGEMAKKKRGEIDAQLEVLRHQHQRGRQLITGIREAFDGYANNDPISTADMLETVSAYVSLLRHHIHLEDHVFYPMARKTLGADEMNEIGREFKRETERKGADTFVRSHKLVVDMGSILTHLRQTAPPTTAS